MDEKRGRARRRRKEGDDDDVLMEYDLSIRLKATYQVSEDHHSELREVKKQFGELRAQLRTAETESARKDDIVK